VRADVGRSDRVDVHRRSEQTHRFERREVPGVLIVGGVRESVEAIDRRERDAAQPGLVLSSGPDNITTRETERIMPTTPADEAPCEMPEMTIDDQRGRAPSRKYPQSPAGFIATRCSSMCTTRVSRLSAGGMSMTAV